MSFSVLRTRSSSPNGPYCQVTGLDASRGDAGAFAGMRAMQYGFERWETVRNMDSRAGAITEALSSGARMQSVRKAATHSTEAMTQKYSRGDEAEVAEVMQLRAARRKNKA